jgi:hypothetical protein
MEPRTEPPGQGRLFVGIEGTLSIREQGGGAVRVPGQPQDLREWSLSLGQFLRLPNDARLSWWGAATFLELATSVPREEHRLDDLRRLSKGLRAALPALLFRNEKVRVELVAAGTLTARAPRWFGLAAAGPGLLLALFGAARVQSPDGARGLMPGEAWCWDGGEVEVRSGVVLRLSSGERGWPALSNPRAR